MEINQWRGPHRRREIAETAEGTNVELVLDDALVVHAYENPQSTEVKVTVSVLHGGKRRTIWRLEGSIAPDGGILNCGDWSIDSPESLALWGVVGWNRPPLDSVKVVPRSREDWEQAQSEEHERTRQAFDRAFPPPPPSD